MPPYKVSDSQLMQALLEVFRKEGYEGASMTLISRATGLKRSSLYHRFPEGKVQMAEEVLEFTGKWVVEHIIEVLAGEGRPSMRLDLALKHITTLYEGGSKPCILRALLMGEETASLPVLVQKRIKSWINAFEGFGKEVGMTHKDAKETAYSSLVHVQGSLILSQALGTTQPFEDSLQNIRNLYNPYFA